jgi:hypothetical protein
VSQSIRHTQSRLNPSDSNGGPSYQNTQKNGNDAYEFDTQLIMVEDGDNPIPKRVSLSQYRSMAPYATLQRQTPKFNRRGEMDNRYFQTKRVMIDLQKHQHQTSNVSFD